MSCIHHYRNLKVCAYKPAWLGQFVGVILLTLCLLMSSPVAFPHNSILPEVSVRLDGDEILLVVIETHIAAFTLREPFGALSPEAVNRLTQMSQQELYDYASGASSYLLSKSRLMVGEDVVSPTNISYPSPQSILRHTLEPLEKKATLQITLRFKNLKKDMTDGVRLLLPTMLGNYRLSTIVDGEVQIVQFVKAADLSAPMIIAYKQPLWQQFTGYLNQGIRHVVPDGWDHMLFIISLALGAPYFWPVLLQASMFTLAHSITLSLAVLGFLTVPAAPVEVIIALSITVISLANLLKVKKPDKAAALLRLRLFLVFVFGLIHGLGFASSFSALNMVPVDLLVTLVGFNLGVEVAQIGVLIIVLILYGIFRERFGYIVRVVCSVFIAIIGIFWVLQRTRVMYEL